MAKKLKKHQKKSEPASWAHDMEGRCRSCTLCGLHRNRKQAVLSVGDPSSRIVFVGEAPGKNEDEKGEPFVGRAGKLLDKMLGAMGLNREQVYITNVIKCRPPGNRTPNDKEREICSSNFLNQELANIRPKVIVALGATAAQTILDTDDSIGKLRGKVHKVEYIDVVATYHPAYLLRQGDDKKVKRKVWEDLQLAMERLKI